jgi:dipeptide/tripeptide permease
MMSQGLRFFIAGGAILVLTGTLQLFVRPRKPSEHRWVNRGTIWAGFCIAMGVLAILVGSGVLKVGR